MRRKTMFVSHDFGWDNSFNSSLPHPFLQVISASVLQFLRRLCVSWRQAASVVPPSQTPALLGKLFSPSHAEHGHCEERSDSLPRFSGK